MILGQGNYRYRLVPEWGRGSKDYALGFASGVATDSQDRVYVVDREPRPAIAVYDREGNFLTAWGQTVFKIPHEIWVGPDDRLYITDAGDHTVRICQPDGVILKTLGTRGTTGALGRPFCWPTRAVLSPNGEIYVSDGYKQDYIHRFSPNGELLQTWGGRGGGPGQFTLPHGICVAPDGRVLVADREPNHRIQVFDPNGRFLAQWPGRLIPMALHIDPDGIVYLAESGGVSIFDLEGRLLSRFVVSGRPFDVNHGVHGIWVDRHGDIYVGEVGVADLLGSSPASPPRRRRYRPLPASSSASGRSADLWLWSLILSPKRTAGDESSRRAGFLRATPGVWSPCSFSPAAFATSTGACSR